MHRERSEERKKEERADPLTISAHKNLSRPKICNIHYSVVAYCFFKCRERNDTILSDVRKERFESSLANRVIIALNINS